MRLTQFFFRRDHFPNGHIFRGKYRLVKRVEPRHLRSLQDDYALEEQNMLYLRHPYLTEEESSGHAKALGKHDEKRAKVIELSRRPFKQDVTIYEVLKHLHVGEKWE